MENQILDLIRAKGFVVLDIATALLLLLELKSGEFCNPTQDQLENIEIEIKATQIAMKEGN
jgi:hypothetical protein